MISRLEKLKMVLVVIFLLSSPFLFSQNWVYQGKQKGKKFGHEYWFSFQNEEDTNSVLKTYSKIGKDSANLEIIIQNNEGEPLPFTLVVIRNLKTHQLTQLLSNRAGKIVLKKDIGKTKFMISLLSFDDFEQIINLPFGKKTTLSIKLGKGPELDVYQINSRRKLSEEKIESIINCVKNGRRNEPSHGCERKREYVIFIHA